MALVFVNIFLKSKEDAAESRYGMVEIISAARAIQPDKVITASQLTIKRVPQKVMEPGAILVKEVDMAYKRVIGKVAVAPIPPGASILQSNLNEPSLDRKGITPLIPPGKKGYILRLGNTDVADLILPGNHVDVLATFTLRQGESTGKQTFTILQNVLVLAVGTVLQEQGREVTSKPEHSEGLLVTLALDSRESERLAQAQSESQGELCVTIRRQGDEGIMVQAPPPEKAKKGK